MKLNFEWEELDKNTKRAKVIGGWILHHDKHALAAKGKESHILCSESMVFIPDPGFQWRIEKPKEESPPKASVSEGF